MKKYSISRWIIQSFIIILILSQSASAAAYYYKNYKNSLKDMKDVSYLCMNSSTFLLHNVYTLGDIESGNGEKAHKVFRDMCRSYQFDYMYVYKLDGKEMNRYYYISAALDRDMDAVLQEEMAQKAIPFELPYEGEKAFWNGSIEIQQEILNTPYGREIVMLAPYLDKDGVFSAIIRMDYNVERLRTSIMRNFIGETLMFLVTMSMGLLALLLIVRLRIVQPLHAISESMNRFAGDTGHIPEKLHITNQDEIGEIAASYEKMSQDISSYVNNIESLTREKQETEARLDIARRIQNGLVPEKFSLNGLGFRASALAQPARAVGGDFYDCFQRDDDHVCIVMGDVSGTGVFAAIFMAVTKTMIREKLIAGCSPAEAFSQTNSELSGHNPEGVFVTAFAAVLNLVSGELCYANAGHSFPVLIREEIEFLKPNSGSILGVHEHVDVIDEVLTLKYGEGILLYTDGVIEAVNPEQKRFGMDNLLAIIPDGTYGPDTAQETLHAISRAVYEFSEGEEPLDDMAALVLFREEDI